jgi:two-component system, NtrC family, sensor histidine kinase HydH
MWKKVIAPTALVSLFWVLVSCGSSYILDQLDDTQTRLLNKNRYVIQAAGAMQENLWRLQAVMLEAAEQTEVRGMAGDELRAQAKVAETSFDRELSRADDNASTIAERALVRAIGERFAQYRESSREQLAHAKLSPEQAARSVEASTRLAQGVALACEELFELGQRLTSEAFQRRDRLRAKVNVARITFLVIGPAVGILLGLWVARGLHHSISEISVTLRGASGDLEQEIGLVEVYPAANLGGLPALQQQVQDVSGRIKQVVEELQRTRREAVRAERLAAVGELAAGVAHELRNPLTSVKLLIQTVERNQPAGSADEQRLRIVHQEVIRMETTIQELLDFARPPKLRRIPHDVRDTLRRALTLVAGRAQQNNVVIVEQLGASPSIVDADPEQLDQVFVNLLLNAIEAMSAGGELHVDLVGGDAQVRADGDSSGRQVSIVFRDTGSGIPDNVMPRLFEPFVTSKERGIGLGLAISRRIMQEHGGRLTASNPPPSGAMFVVELPLATAPTADAAYPIERIGGPATIEPPKEAVGAQASGH